MKTTESQMLAVFVPLATRAGARVTVTIFSMWDVSLEVVILVSHGSGDCENSKTDPKGKGGIKCQIVAQCQAYTNSIW